MAERTNALVLKTRGGKTPVGSNPTAPASTARTWLTPNILRSRLPFVLNLLKDIKEMETSAFGVCTLRVASPGKRCRRHRKTVRYKEVIE